MQKIILIANPKGGCGKSTMAVHLASWFARCDEIVYLGDLDRQQSSRLWLEERPSSLPSIRHWPIQEGVIAEPPKDYNVAILDTPAGLHGKQLKEILRFVDRVVVPVSPSKFDLLASQAFFEELAATKAVRKDKVEIAIVGMRIDPRTLASQRIVSFLQQYDLPLISCIRQVQRYVTGVETGTTIFDVSQAADDDMVQWRPILDWLVSRRS